MRIGLNLLFLIPGEVGGTETYTRGLLKGLARVDTYNQYIVFINRESRQLDFIHQANFSVVDCGVHAKNRAARLFWEQFILPLQVRWHNLDVLHSLGYIAPLILPCKSVVTIHDLNYKFVPESMAALTRVMQKIFVTLTAHRANHIIAVSEFVRGQVIKYLKLRPGKITSIHEAAELEVFAPAERNPELLVHYGIFRPYLFAFSSLTPHKNIVGLIKAFAQIKQAAPNTFQLVIAGHQPRNTPMIKLAADLGLSNEDIILTGYLDNKARTALLGNATAFAFPSLYEGFGLPILEAMASRVAVACSNCASLPEVAGEAAIYFDPLNIKQMTDVLVLLLSNDDERRVLIARGEKNLQRFSWEKTAYETIAVYEKTVALSVND